MIHIEDKQRCCGCSACAQKCPKHCIEMVEDQEGFLYPSVDAAACVDCGLCGKVCPMLDGSPKLKPLSILAAVNCDDEERRKSSSGGIFIALATLVINNGGAVFGAVFDEAWEVHHTHATCMADVYPMMGSKYLQSRIENSYSEVLAILKQGRLVLFVGSPCQVAGLRTFLRNKDYKNLIMVDFLCHGVPSPGVWRSYLRESLEQKMPPLAADGKNTVLKSSLNSKSPIGDIQFRDKSDGWKKFRFVVRQKSALKADKNSVLLSDIHDDNVFMQGFLSNVYLRPSCYGCRCKNGKSHSDLTIGDYWGAKIATPELDDDKGLSLVLVNSEKGNEYFEQLHCDSHVVQENDAHMHNGGFSENIWMPYERRKFYKYFIWGRGFYKSWQYCNQVSLKHRLKVKVLHLAKCLLRK